MDSDEGLIDLPIGPAHAGKVRNSRAIRHDLGQPSRTRWRALERWAEYTLCHVQLLTGRHHQIRVHMAAVGHPVVGDKIYGRDGSIFLRFTNRTITEDDWRTLQLRRQALHSHSLTFEHPTRGRMRVASPWPADLRAFCEQLDRS
jgi:23S rRNA-/tRNA-specific pseudouridylate synthase